jgi:hypothetical protein
MSCTSCNENLSIPSTTLPPCPEGSPCEEFFFTDCTQYKGPNLVSLGINHNMSLKQAMVALNKKLTTAFSSKTYTITVSTTQTITVVEYINHLGDLVSKSVSPAQSPQTICAQEGSPVKTSGTGVLSASGATCTITTT